MNVENDLVASSEVNHVVSNHSSCGQGISSEVRSSIEAWRTRGQSRAFGVCVEIANLGGDKWHTIDREMAIADQGSDITIIYPPLPKLLGLKVYPVASLLKSHTKLVMNTAGVGSVQLTHWTCLKLKVAGVERDVWAFVSPALRPNMSLLLGVPYLASVDAKLHIREEVIELGDSSRGENVVLLKAPPRGSANAKLHVKHPSVNTQQAQLKNKDDSTEPESEDTEFESEDEDETSGDSADECTSESESDYDEHEEIEGDFH